MKKLSPKEKEFARRSRLALRNEIRRAEDRVARLEKRGSGLLEKRQAELDRLLAMAAIEDDSDFISAYTGGKRWMARMM